MRKRIVILAALPLLGASLLTLAQSPAATDRLNQAKQTETRGGLGAASEIYESVLRDFPNDRPAGARAIARIVQISYFNGDDDKMQDACRRLKSAYATEVSEDVSVMCRPKARSRPGIFIAKMDAQSGVIQEPVRSLTVDPNIQEAFPSLSPDGGLLAFRRTPAPDQRTTVIVRSLADKTERTMRACSDASNAHGRQNWFPDGRVLSFFPGLTSATCGAVTDSKSGELLQSLPLGNAISLWSALSPDGTMLHMIGAVNLMTTTSVTTMVTQDLGTGTPTRVFALPFVPGGTGGVPTSWHILALSPDGRIAAYIRSGSASRPARLVRFDTDDDRHYRELLVAGTQMKGVAWSKDGSRIFFGVSADGVKWRIMQMPAEGGSASFTGLEVDGLQYFEPNHDNTEIVFDGLLYTISAPGPYTPPSPPAAEPDAPDATPLLPPGRGGARGARGN
jgi:WD40 repeat protein